MPLVTIQIYSNWGAEEKKQLLDTLQIALSEGLNVPKQDQQFRIQQYAKEDVMLFDDQSEKYIVIEIALFLGRSLEIKKRLYQAINQRLKEIGITEKDIFIVLHEIPKENFGIQGGIPASELH